MLELEHRLMLPSTEKRLSHEKLIVYQTTLKFVALTIEIIRQFPKGNADIIDQLKRDVCCLLKIAKNEEVNVAKAHLFEIVSMLSKMCR